jgi:RimJ/RimL family protein N-acetyltransferase
MIETDRLTLRPWTEHDRAPLARLINTPAMLRFFPGPMTPAQCDTYFERRMSDQARHGLCYWAVELKATGALIGSCGGRVADDYAGTPVSGMHELGWRIGEAWWRQGFAVEAMRGAIDWLWENTDAPFAAAWTSVPNMPSQALMQKLDMTRRIDLDFDHPRLSPESPLRRHIVYSIARPL